MTKKARISPMRIARSEKGISLVLTLILLMIGSLLIVPLFDMVTTGFKSGEVFERKNDDLFAADAGIQDATWNIKYGYLFSLPTYSQFDFNTTWSYDLPSEVNGKDVHVNIKNVWVPCNIPIPDQSQASAIITAEKLMITGSATEDTAKITLTYSPGAGEDVNIESVGVWLPRGFTYTAGSSNLESNPYAPYYAVPTVQPHQGNQAVLWTFNSVPFSHFPNVDTGQFPMTAEITFRFNASQPGAKPKIVPWVTTSGVADIPFSWDADISIYHLTANAGSTTIEDYTFREEVRHLRSAIAGDYKAAGNSLMIDTNGDSHAIRDQLLNSSEATISTIPSDATVGAAYLYWSGWLNNSRLVTVMSDTCANFNNWNNGATWNLGGSYTNYYFSGHYSSGDESARYNTLKFSQDLHSYAAGTVLVSWDQWVTALADIFWDSCGSFDNWDNGSAWSYYSHWGSSYFRAHYTSGDNTTRLLTLDYSLDLSGCAGNAVQVSWNQWEGGTPSATDGLDFAFSGDGGATWSNNYPAFRGNIGGSAQGFSFPIPSQYLTDNFKMRFYVVGMNDYGEYAYVDSIHITPAYDNADGLDFAFSADGGVTWSNNLQAFRGDIGNSAVNFSYTIPVQYISDSFKFRFHLAGASGAGERIYVDNFKIVTMPADTSISFKIDGNQVYYDGDGQPAQGVQPLTAESTQVFASNPAFGGFSYASYRDVTSLVRAYSAKAPDPAVNHPGNAAYTVGDVSGDTGSEISYAGWSLIVVYSSAQTWGHQLYLFDKFTYSYYTTDMDFDHDGNPGGYISGFIVPNEIPGELNAAGMTCFVGEGDDWLNGDFIAFNAPESYQTHPADIPDSYKLWDGTYSTAVPNSNTLAHPCNVWNGKSVGSSADGVDIDTFNIPWSSGLLQPGDTSARIDLWTQQDNYNLIYIILSFRSSVTTGNALSYLIR